MGKELTPEQIEHNKKSVKRTAIICMVIVAIVAAVAIVVMLTKKGGSKSNGTVSGRPSYSDAKAIFEEVTDDSYYLHTVWLFLSKNDASGSGTANWTMEEVTKGVTPTMK